MIQSSLAEREKMILSSWAEREKMILSSYFSYFYVIGSFDFKINSFVRNMSYEYLYARKVILYADKIKLISVEIKLKF